jgi:hypothetical protein
MSNWSDLLVELNQMGSPFDVLRRKYIQQLHEYTGRNVIAYYSGFLQKPELKASNAVNDNDKNGLMTAVNGLDVSLGLDLILHTPGGDTAATESIVDYLWQKFGKNIRCFVPQMAMSAGTMIACSCSEIWMGRQSSLGPVDPQFNGVPAHGVIEEFNRALTEIQVNPQTIPLWQAIVAKYPPAFLGECEKAIKWSSELVTTWLLRNMLDDDADKNEKIKRIVTEIIDHSISYAHNRHLSSKKCESIGLRIKHLESDQELQDKVLSVHHIYFQTLSSTPAFKIIENHVGKAFILQAQQMLVPQLGPGPQGINPAFGQLPPMNPIEEAQPTNPADPKSRAAD